MSVPNEKPYAVVFALDTINGLQTARTLAKHGVPVIGIARDPRHPFCKTRVCEKIIFADTDSEAVVPVLEAVGAELGQKGVIFPCNDLNVRPVSLHRKSLERWFEMVLPDPDVYDMLMQKTSLYSFAEREGFAIPRTFFLQSRSDAERAAGQVRYPCILKPSSRSDEWDQKSRAKAYKVRDAGQLLALYDEHCPMCPALVLQEWIEGPDSNLYTCYCYFSRSSEPLVTFVTQKIRQWPPQIGEGCLGVECRNDTVLQETLRLFNCVNLRGMGYLEMKRDARTGQYFIIEPNIGRPTSKSSIAEAGGVELVYTMYCDALGWELPPNRQQHYGSAKWIYFRRDLQSALYYWRRGELSVGQWLRSLRGIKVEALFSWSDPAPFFFDLLLVANKFFSAEARQKRAAAPWMQKGI